MGVFVPCSVTLIKSLKSAIRAFLQPNASLVAIKSDRIQSVRVTSTGNRSSTDRS
jgi:hypothetical protein